MQNILITLFLLAAQPTVAAIGENSLSLSGFISAWTQDCSGPACGLPVPGERNRPVALRLVLPSAPGEASAARASEKLRLPGGGELSAELDFYAVCPYVGKEAPAASVPAAEAAPAAENCPGRYFQAQVSLGGQAPAFCASALNAADFAPFPVMMCAGAAPGGLRYGITLHRQPL